MQTESVALRQPLDLQRGGASAQDWHSEFLQGAADGLQALSPVGRCKSFDASGDGYGRGEGCVAAVLQLSDKAETGGALAVLRSSVVNQDGRSSSLTAPNGPSQTALVLQALDIAGALALSCRRAM